MSNAKAGSRIAPPLAESLKLTQLLFQSVSVDGWAEARKTIVEHPEMLGVAADILVKDFIEFCREHKRNSAALVLRRYLDFLNRVRPSGTRELDYRELDDNDLERSFGTQTRLDFPKLVELVRTFSRAIEAERRYALQDEKKGMLEAVSLWEQVLEAPLFVATPLSWRLDALNAAGNAFLGNYLLHSQKADLDTSLRCYGEAIAKSPPDWPGLHRYLYNSGRGFYACYVASGALQDLERSVEFSEKAIQSAPPQSPNLPMYLSFAGSTLGTRYENTGQIEDLDKAIEIQRKSVEQLPPNAIQLPVFLNQLGSNYRKRFTRTGAIEDIELAVSLQEESVERSEGDMNDAQAARLTNLGNSRLEVYSVTADPTDLNRAIEVFERAIDLTDSGSLYRPSRLNNLGNGLRNRYFNTGSIDDLKRSIERYKNAIELTPDFSPELPSRFYNLANAMTTLSDYSQAQTDVEEAIQSYRLAATRGLEVSREWALSAALNWGDWAAGRQAWGEAVEAYGYGMQAIDQLFHTQLLRANKEAWLRQARRLPSQAAYALARNSDFAAAVTALEGGRARLLADSLERARADLNRLAETGHRELYERYSAAARRLTLLEAADIGQQSVPVSDLPAELRTARAELDQAVQAIQQIPEYRSFFHPPEFEQIQRALTCPPDDSGRETVGVYLTATAAGGLALIVHSKGVQQVWLDFNEADLSRLLVKRDGENVAGGYLLAQFDGIPLRKVLDEALPLLGEKIMGPVAAALRAILGKSRSAARTTRVVLIPTGLLSLLPLHAAGYKIREQDLAPIDEFVLTYATSARALASSQEARGSGSDAAPRLFGIGNPMPLPANLAPLVFADDEVEEVAQFFDSRAEVLCGPRASLAEVEQRLSAADYLHFSCHGIFDSQAPLRSGLTLSNGERLTLGDLLARPPFDHTRLVVLSACQTAITEFNELPDEAVGLPSGFLQAGAAGVIGSLWSVYDLSTTVLMREFYRLHLVEGLGIGSALRGAQQWLRSATAQEMKLAEYWERIYEESGRRDANSFRAMRIYRANPESRPFQHPYYWAAFTCNGL